MRKLLIIFSIFVMFLSGMAAEALPFVDEAPFLPVSPRVIGQGGAFISVANGYDALFYNPAGFANTEFSLTLASVSTWLYMNPAVMQDVLDAITNESETQMAGDIMSILDEQITTGGLGVGLSSGVGLVAGGLGLGAALIIDSALYGGRNMFDASGDLHGTFGVVAGYALDFDLLGMNWKIGADIRPMYRVHAAIENSVAIQMVSALLTGGNMQAAWDVLNANAAMSGLGVGLDLGAIVELGPLHLALSMRDIFGTKFEYYRNNLDVILAALETGDPLPEVTPASEANYVIPMDISIGAGLDFDFLKPLLGLTVSADLQDFIGVIKYNRTPWTLLHLGAEATLLGFVKARVGFNQGYITMGAGLHLLILDLNISAFTREMGQHINDQPNSGAVVELAIRI